MAWRLAGAYFENCSCDVLCPCLTSPIAGPADTERCLVPYVCRIDAGYLDDIRLDGLVFVMVFDTPAIMSAGHWRVALYLDARADARQHAALETILRGERGGVPERWSALIGEWLGTKSVPITFHADGSVRQAVVPGIMDIAIEGVRMGGRQEVVEVHHVVHDMDDTLPIARSRRGVFHDPANGLAFDNTGKNGHYGPSSGRAKARRTAGRPGYGRDRGRLCRAGGRKGQGTADV
jgi:hypothetical protein